MVRVTVVVLGDIGRSPRMQYHASSLIKLGYDIDIIGYGGSKPIKEITDNAKVKIKTLRDCPEFHYYFPRLMSYILKTVWQAVTLFFCLLFKKRSDLLLVQTPPAIPTLFVCWLYCFVFRVLYIIDWHNYGFTNMALTLGDKNVLVRVSHVYEGFFGRRAHFNLCVTEAMKEDLKTRWNIKATVLHDKPFGSFSSVSTDTKHLFFKRICEQHPVFAGENLANSTVFTSKLPNGIVALKPNRPALLVSSTSWTEDEDFSILLSALKTYDKSKAENLPDLICVITGKGPLKNYYIKLIENFEWQRVKIITPWLEPEDYPLMLGSADLGVSLHTSTSGLDLPMKVVDMFGCGLPVAAYYFKALPELVHVNRNGTIFNTSDELSEQLQEWFKDFPKNMDKFIKYRRYIEANFQQLRWHENWTNNVLAIFERVQLPLSKCSTLISESRKNE